MLDKRDVARAMRHNVYRGDELIALLGGTEPPNRSRLVEVSQDLEHIATQATVVARYLRFRAGCLSHQTAYNRAQTALRRLRRIFGFTYP